MESETQKAQRDGHLPTQAAICTAHVLAGCFMPLEANMCVHNCFFLISLYLGNHSIGVFKELCHSFFCNYIVSRGIDVL